SLDPCGAADLLAKHRAWPEEHGALPATDDEAMHVPRRESVGAQDGESTRFFEMESIHRRASTRFATEGRIAWECWSPADRGSPPPSFPVRTRTIRQPAAAPPAPSVSGSSPT